MVPLFCGQFMYHTYWMHLLQGFTKQQTRIIIGFNWVFPALLTFPHFFTGFDLFTFNNTKEVMIYMTDGKYSVSLFFTLHISVKL